MNRFTLTFFLVFLIFLIPVFGESLYPSLGGEGDDFSSDSSRFTTGVNAFVRAKSLDASRHHPLVGDMDGDGVDEIVVYDSGIFKVFSGSTLNFEIAYDPLGLSGGSNDILFDIDGDNFTELIFSNNSQNSIVIAEYNGTHIYSEKIHLIAFPFNNNAVFGCGALEECVAVYYDGTNFDLRGVTFNSSQRRDSWIFVNGLGPECLTHSRDFGIGDYDNDGEIEYVFTFYDTLNEDVGFKVFNINSSLHINEEVYDSFASGLTIADCSTGNSQFTSPIFFDIDETIPKDEIIFGYKTDSSHFKIRAYRGSGVELFTVPSLFDNANGEFMSNPFVTSAYVETGLRDVCVFGYDFGGEIFELLCTSREGGVSTRYYEYDLTGEEFNLTRNGYLYSEISHSFEADEYNDVLEVLNSYGVWELDTDSCDSVVLVGDVCDMSIVFPNPLEAETSFIPSDYQGVGFEDLIGITSNGIFYIDDQFVNSQAYFTGDYEINPCMKSQSAKTNTTVEITFTVDDVNGDNVNVTGILYFGEGNDSQTQTDGGSPGRPYTLYFIANVTTSGSVFQLQVTDDKPEHQGVPATKNITFKVSNTGVEWGSGCTDEGDWTPAFLPGENGTDVVSESDMESMRNALIPEEIVPRPFRALAGIFILIVLVVVGIVIIRKELDISEPTVLIYGSAVILLIGWLFLTWLEILPGWPLIVGILFGSAFLGFKFYHRVGV